MIDNKATDTIKTVMDIIDEVRRMLINVDKIIYVCEMGDKACIRYSNTDEAWGIVQTAESFDEICQMLKKGDAE